MSYGSIVTPLRSLFYNLILRQTTKNSLLYIHRITDRVFHTRRTVESLANISRMLSRLTGVTTETMISLLVPAKRDKEDSQQGWSMGIATWKLNYVPCYEMSYRGPWLVSTTNCSLQYADLPLLIPVDAETRNGAPWNFFFHADFGCVYPKLSIVRRYRRSLDHDSRTS